MYIYLVLFFIVINMQLTRKRGVCVVDKVIVLGARDYDFVDSDTGERKVGATVHFIVLDDYHSGVGYIPRRTSVPIEVYRDMKELQYPFLAELVLENYFTSRGVVRSRVKSFSYLSSVSME